MISNEAEIQKLNPEFFLLPPSVREKAIFHGTSVESGWRREHVEVAIQAAAASKLANLGGQLQFQTSFGICEAYWVNFDSTERKTGETWADYVNRSFEEVSRQFKNVDAQTDYIAEATKWPDLKNQIETNGWDPMPSAVFILYFEAEKGD